MYEYVRYPNNLLGKGRFYVLGQLEQTESYVLFERLLNRESGVSLVFYIRLGYREQKYVHYVLISLWHYSKILRHVQDHSFDCTYY